MTATNNQAAWENMKSKLKAMGGNFPVVIGEPKSIVQDGTVAIIPVDGEIDETVLNAPREIHTVMLRRYANALKDPQDGIEFGMDSWRAEILADVWGEFDLGGNIAYPLPTRCRWTYGYQTIGAGDRAVMYRLLDVTVAYRLDVAATFAA